MTTAIALFGATSEPASPPLNGTAAPTPTSIDKATLTVHEPRALKSGGYEPGDLISTITFHFNPKELNFTKSAKWPRQPAKQAGKSAPPEFSGAEPTKLSFEMFLDSSQLSGGSVVDVVESVLSCCIPTSTTKDKDKPHPPLVIFHWGKIHSMPAFINQVSAKYTRFNSDGLPVRATCNISMEDMPAEIHSTNPTSGSTGVRGQHLVCAGDSLASIAYLEYQDPSMWRAIAAINNIHDPRRVRIGSTLLLPRPDELEVS